MKSKPFSKLLIFIALLLTCSPSRLYAEHIDISLYKLPVLRELAQAENGSVYLVEQFAIKGPFQINQTAELLRSEFEIREDRDGGYQFRFFERGVLKRIKTDTLRNGVTISILGVKYTVLPVDDIKDFLANHDENLRKKADKEKNFRREKIEQGLVEYKGEWVDAELAELFKARDAVEARKSEERRIQQAADAEKRKMAEEQARKELIENQFSSWDGSHRNLTTFIKRAMNDPKSYSHVETVYWDMGDHLVVRTSFRGNNAFGGVILDHVKAKVALDGKILEILTP